MSKETVVDRDKPVSPLCFRGFRLHTVYKQPHRGDMVHHIHFPHLLGGINSSLIEYDAERFPLDLVQSLKIAINLQPRAKDHWTIAADQILPSRLEESQQAHEANKLAHAQQEGKKEAEVFHRGNYR